MSNRVRKIKPYEAKEFVNHLGHVINVNDPIISITMCTRSAQIRVGRYLGYRERSTYYSADKKQKYVVVEVKASKQRFVHKQTGEEYNFNEEYKRLPYVTYPHNNREPYGSPAYLAKIAEYNQARDIYNAKVNEARKDFEWKKFPFKRLSTLQLNKVYPADLSLAALSDEGF